MALGDTPSPEQASLGDKRPAGQTRSDHSPVMLSRNSKGSISFLKEKKEGLGVVRTSNPKACGLVGPQQTHLIFLAGEVEKLQIKKGNFLPTSSSRSGKDPKTLGRLGGHQPMLLGARMMNEPSPPFSQTPGDQPTPEKCHIAHKQVSPSRSILCRTSLWA